MHYHCLVRYPPPDVNWVWTLHGNLSGADRVDDRTICVSQNHARRHGTDTFVRNGVRLDEYDFRAQKGEYDLFLARLHSVKGWQVAIAAAKRCRVRLVLAGGWRPSLSRFVKFVGEVGGPRKRDLLAGARCLWMPVRWEDPCPVNILEALASGTPIIGSPRGSLPELVSPEVGGLGTTLDQLVALRGRGINFPVALEGALKLKEISYIHAEGYPAGEMKHGPNALIDERLPVLFINTREDGNRASELRYEKTHSNIVEVKAREGIVISVLTEGDSVSSVVSDYVIEIPAASDLLSPILSIIPLQLLAYHIAVRRGCDVDQPRNLAKSVTVE